MDAVDVKLPRSGGGLNKMLSWGAGALKGIAIHPLLGTFSGTALYIKCATA